MILNFWGEVLTVGGQENIFLSTSRSQFVATGPAKIKKKIGQQITRQELILNRNLH